MFSSKNNTTLEVSFDAELEKIRQFFLDKHLNVAGKTLNLNANTGILKNQIDKDRTTPPEEGDTSRHSLAALRKQQDGIKANLAIKTSKATELEAILAAIASYQGTIIKDEDNYLKPLEKLRFTLQNIEVNKLADHGSLFTRLKNKLVTNTSTAEYYNLTNIVNARIAVHDHLVNTMKRVEPLIASLQQKSEAIPEGSQLDAKAKYLHKIKVLSTLNDSLNKMETPEQVKAAAQAIEEAVIAMRRVGGEKGKAATLVKDLRVAVQEEIKHLPKEQFKMENIKGF